MNTENTRKLGALQRNIKAWHDKRDITICPVFCESIALFMLINNVRNLKDVKMTVWMMSEDAVHGLRDQVEKL